MELGFRIEVVQGDALEFEADVLMLKYAGKPYGLDRKVRSMLMDAGNNTLNRRSSASGSISDYASARRPE